MNASRLLKLAEHLETGNLGHKEFKLNTYSFGKRNDLNACGTRGCALGECVLLWPDEWKFYQPNMARGTGSYYPTLEQGAVRKENKLGPVKSASLFFEIKCVEAGALFLPDCEHSVIEELDATATRHEVAARIRKFVAFKQENP